jgi:hypothetical protein
MAVSAVVKTSVLQAVRHICDVFRKPNASRFSRANTTYSGVDWWEVTKCMNEYYHGAFEVSRRKSESVGVRLLFYGLTHGDAEQPFWWFLGAKTTPPHRNGAWHQHAKCCGMRPHIPLTISKLSGNMKLTNTQPCERTHATNPLRIFAYKWRGRNQGRSTVRSTAC